MKNITLKFDRITFASRNLIKGTGHLVRNLAFAASILCWSHAALAAPVVNSFAYTFREAMTNSGVEPTAVGKVLGSQTLRGATDSQKLTLTVSKLQINTTYHLVAFLDHSPTPTAVADFTTTAKGAASVAYVKSIHPGAHPLPAVLDPVSNLRELDIVNSNGITVLEADLLSPDSFSYSLKRVMDNTGFLAGVTGVLQLRGSPRLTSASVTAIGLTPLTSYQLLVNGVSVTTKSSTRLGKLVIAGPKTGLPLVLDVTTVALADSGTNIILKTTGLGIPSAAPLTATPASPVVLGAAANYAVLAGSTVTSVGATAVTGNLGVSPGSAVTGFPPGTISGATDAGNSAAAQAELDLTTAFNDAAGRTVGPVSVAGNLGGSTLPPGLYKSTSSLEISSGDLTLDAQGDANAVFIFQIASTLTTTAGRQVILSGGAKAANVFWQVGTSATLGTTSVFKGTIMADQSITLNNGATLNGRALARIAGVTLDSNTITLPAQ